MAEATKDAAPKATTGKAKPVAAKPAGTMPKPPAPPPAEPRETVERAKAVTVKPRAVVQVKEPPDLVRVRALEKGHAGLDVDLIVRNPGEVFDMATAVMRRMERTADGTGFQLVQHDKRRVEHPIEGATVIETEKGFFELPGWVELAPDDEVSDSMGHAVALKRQVTKQGTTITPMDVL